MSVIIIAKGDKIKMKISHSPHSPKSLSFLYFLLFWVPPLTFLKNQFSLPYHCKEPGTYNNTRNLCKVPYEIPWMSIICNFWFMDMLWLSQSSLTILFLIKPRISLLILWNSRLYSRINIWITSFGLQLFQNK